MRKICRFIFFVLIVYVPVVLQAQSAANKLASYIDELRRDKDLRGASISIKVTDIDGATIADYQSDMKMVPASIQKLITTGAGFVVLGGEHRFTTLLACAGTLNDSALAGKLYIVGGGDPSLGSDSFERTLPDSLFSRFAQALERRGIKKFEGTIVTVAASFVPERVHPSWEWEDIGSYYGAGVSGLNFRENSFSIRLKTSDMHPENLSITGDFPYDCTLASALVPVHRDSACNAAVYSSPLGGVYALEGGVPSSGKEYKLDAALRNPEIECAARFARFLEARGFSNGRLSAEAMFVEPAERLDTVYIELSPKYSEIARKTNVYSNNLYADAIFKAVSKTRSGESSYKKSAQVVVSILKSMGLDTDRIRLIDGSGLSRQNLTTTDFVCDYLRAIVRAVPDFESCLPMPGGEGTLKNFMPGHGARGRIRLKSGSMTGVLNYAGYVKNHRGETRCLAVMINNFTCKTGLVRKKMERIIGILAEN